MSEVVHPLRSPGMRRWVKCILGLDELGIAILPHIKKAFQEYYDKHFWDYHYLGCTTDCQHDHSIHLGCKFVGHPPSDCAIHSIRCPQNCKNNKACTCWQSPELFAEWKLSGGSGRCSCYHFCKGDEKKCRHSSGSCREYFNKLVVGHKNMHGEDFWYQVKKSRRGFFLETKADCTACQSGFELLKKLLIDPDSEKIYWRNFNFPEDFSDSWKLAKAFMPSGNANIDDPTKVDPVALLTVMNNCRLFDVETDLIDKIILMRNFFVHIGSQKESIKTEQTDEFFALIIGFLERLGYGYGCRKHIATIEKIKESEVTAEMFTKANAKHVQCLLNTLSDYTSAGKDISKIVTDIEFAINDKVEAERGLIKEQELQGLELELARQNCVNSDQEKLIDAKNAIIDNLQTKISKLEQEMGVLKQELAGKERVIFNLEKMTYGKNLTIDNRRKEKKNK